MNKYVYIYIYINDFGFDIDSLPNRQFVTYIFNFFYYAKNYSFKFIVNWISECQGTCRSIGIFSFPLGISGREDGVYKHKGPYDLGAQSSAFAVPMRDHVGTTTIPFVIILLKGLDDPITTDGSQALSYHVHHGSDQRHFTSH